RAGQFTLGN
nr:superinducible protein 24, SIP24=cyclophilin homolog, peak C [mice, BALB/c 3T3, Peptide Partial, 9 aa] [Mus sp.]